MAIVRIQKILAQAGVSSRRAAERLIVEGRVRLDGRVVTELGTKADSKAKIELDGRRIVQDQFCYGVMNKPRGMLTTLSDPEGRPTIGAVLKQVGLRVIPVGRLDFNTSGVLLFTNDGDFAQTLTHAKGKVPKVYIAKVRGELNERELARWAERIEIDGRKTEPASVRALRREGGHTWLEITIFEGRNRQVRRLGEHAGTPLVRLVRVTHAGIDAEGLRPGEWRLLTLDELKTLKAAYGTPKKIRGVAQGIFQTDGQRNAAAREKFEKIREKWRVPRAGDEEGVSGRADRGTPGKGRSPSVTERDSDFGLGKRDSRATGRRGEGAKKLTGTAHGRTSVGGARGKEVFRGKDAPQKERGVRPYEGGLKEGSRGAPRGRIRSDEERPRREAARTGAPTRTNVKGRPPRRSEAEERPRRDAARAGSPVRTDPKGRPPRRSEAEGGPGPRQVKRAGDGSGFAPRPKTRR